MVEEKETLVLVAILWINLLREGTLIEENIDTIVRYKIGEGGNVGTPFDWDPHFWFIFMSLEYVSVSQSVVHAHLFMFFWFSFKLNVIYLQDWS